MNFKTAAFILSCTLATAIQAEPAKTTAKDFMTKEHDLEVRTQLQEKISQLTSDEQARKKLVYMAKRRITLCKSCHGEDGNSITPNVPSLAGQNPVYLVDQFMRFGDGRRNDFTMNSLAKSIKDEDKIKLAIYFSEQKIKSAGTNQPDLIPRGKDRYEKFCLECHGTDGRGSEKGYAHLAGQRPEYIVKMLQEFKNKTGRRSNPWMTARANTLTDSDMQAVAAYLASVQ